MRKEDARNFHESVSRSKPNKIRGRAARAKRSSAKVQRTEQRLDVFEELLAARGAEGIADPRSNVHGEDGK
jgi:hypothetical protein